MKKAQALGNPLKREHGRSISFNNNLGSSKVVKNFYKFTTSPKQQIEDIRDKLKIAFIRQEIKKKALIQF